MTKQTADSQTEAQGQTEPKVIWDDSEMVSSYANVVNATSTREEFMVFFGVNQTWNPAQAEVAIKLTNRIVMSPFAAKRLSLILANVLREYEANFGTIPLDLQTVQETGREQPN